MSFKSDVLVVMPCPKKGGAEKQFTFIIQALEERNIKYVVVFSEKCKSCAINIMHLILDIIVLVIVHRPTVAIVYDVYGKYAIPLFKLFGIKTIYSERNNGKHKLRLGKWCIANADRLVANSKTAIFNMKDYVSAPIEYIPNGVIIPKNKKSKDNNLSITKILVPARIHPTKYQLLLIEVAKVCSNLEFYLYGKVDDEQYYAMFKDAIERTHIANIHYMGFEEGLEKRFRDFDLVLLASNNEGNSNVILEAFANMVLCVASKMDSNEELIRDERFLFENTYEDIVKVIERVDNMNLSEKAAILEDNWQFVKMFSVNKMCDRYLELIDNMR